MHWTASVLSYLAFIWTHRKRRQTILLSLSPLLICRRTTVTIPFHQCSVILLLCCSRWAPLATTRCTLYVFIHTDFNQTSLFTGLVLAHHRTFIYLIICLICSASFVYCCHSMLMTIVQRGIKMTINRPRQSLFVEDDDDQSNDFQNGKYILFLSPNCTRISKRT